MIMISHGDRSSVGLELRIVVPDVAGSNPVDRPLRHYDKEKITTKKSQNASSARGI